MNASISKLPTLVPMDRRLNAYRPDLADSRLQDRCTAEHYVDSKPGNIKSQVADLKSQPDSTSNIEHQLLLGEEVSIFEDGEAWCWVQSKRDGYVGYVDQKCVAAGAIRPTHVITAPRTFAYPEAELRQPPVARLSMGSRVTIIDQQSVRGTQYCQLDSGGFIVEQHSSPIDDFSNDYVSICEKLIGTPYLWGGASGFGIDCSGLVQLAMCLCGREELRDSDMQAATIGVEIDPGKKLENLQRGDLIFWRGHIAVHQGNVGDIPHIIHASGHTMNVSTEPLEGALKRIAYLYESPIGFRRP